ncbi:auxin-induced protein 6B-like [Hibiscus syriacus]|uniref:dolichol kinase n=1 Tax=Hibiscus syriacus TaxID=106335 RepID=A0A6A2XAG1_HIBSY|nr:auxin-induced protein 6B-like [Hibiscus syriacus]
MRGHRTTTSPTPIAGCFNVSSRSYLQGDYGLEYHPQFLDLAFGAALAVFLVLEIIRVWRIWPLGHPVHQFMSAFTDHRDSDLIIVSHFSLLLGCALPIWMSSGFSDRPLTPFTGILTIGIGETMASMVGHKYGVLRWSKTGSTSTGIASVLAACLVLVPLLASTGYILTQHWLPVLIAVTTSGLLEAYATQLDNAFIPLILLTAIREYRESVAYHSHCSFKVIQNCSPLYNSRVVLRQLTSAQAQHRGRSAIEVLKKLVDRRILYHSYSMQVYGYVSSQKSGSHSSLTLVYGYHAIFSLRHWLQQPNWLPTLEATLALDEESVRRVGDDSVRGPTVSRKLRLIRILMRDLAIN